MKSKFLKITMIMILIMSLFQVNVHAELGQLTVTAITDKDTYEVGEIVTVTIDWEKEAEAVGLLLKYDKDKLEFDSISLGSNFYDTTTEGQISVNWASLDGNALTEVTIKLKAKAEGKAVLQPEATEIADGNLDPATGYTNVSKEITIGTTGQEPGENPGENPGQQPGETPDENEGGEGTTGGTQGTQKPGTEQNPDKNEGGEGITGGTQNTQKPGTEQKPSDKTPTDDKVDDTIADKVINNAGEDTTMIIAIAAFALIAIVGFKKYRSLADVR